MRKIGALILIATLPISNAFAVAVSTAAIAGGAAAASNNARHAREQQNQRMNQERLRLVNSRKNNAISGVFICDATNQEKQKGYYAVQYDKCRFWSNEKGYYSLPINKVHKAFLSDKEIVNVFFDHHSQKFEFYYR